jgi:hypothetical protein
MDNLLGKILNAGKPDHSLQSARDRAGTDARRILAQGRKKEACRNAKDTEGGRVRVPHSCFLNSLHYAEAHRYWVIDEATIS